MPCTNYATDYYLLIMPVIIYRQVSDKQDFPVLENVMKSILKEKQPFERLEVSKENLLKMFEYNPFKVCCVTVMSPLFWSQESFTARRAPEPPVPLVQCISIKGNVANGSSLR